MQSPDDAEERIIPQPKTKSRSSDIIKDGNLTHNKKHADQSLAFGVPAQGTLEIRVPSGSLGRAASERGRQGSIGLVQGIVRP